MTAEEIREHIQRVGALDFCGVNIAEAQVALAKLQVGVLGEIALQLAIQNDLLCSIDQRLNWIAHPKEVDALAKAAASMRESLGSDQI